MKLSGIHDESAFVCWVPFTLMKGDVVIAAIKSQMRKTTHKYGIEVPTRVEHAYRLTTFGKQIQNNFEWRNTLRCDAIEPEMTNVGHCV